MVRRSTRLQAGNYYSVSNSHNSIPVATISYYETPVRYVNLNSYVWNANCLLSANICVFLFPAGFTEGLVSEPPNRRVSRHPLPKASMNIRVTSGLCGVMLSSFSSSHHLPQVSNQSPAQPLEQDAGAESLISSLLLSVSVDSSHVHIPTFCIVTVCSHWLPGIWFEIIKYLANCQVFSSSLQQKQQPAVAERQPALFSPSSSSCLFVSDQTERVFMWFIDFVYVHILDTVMDFPQVFGSRSFCWPQSHPTTFWWWTCQWQRSCQFTLTLHNRTATWTLDPHLWVWNPIWLLVNFTYCISQ